MYGIWLLGADFRQNELILEFPTKSMPLGFRAAAILDHWTAFLVGFTPIGVIAITRSASRSAPSRIPWPLAAVAIAVSLSGAAASRAISAATRSGGKCDCSITIEPSASAS